MLNSSGKCLKKKKTCFKQGEYSPIFNQTLIFDLSTESLEQTVFLILLCTKLMVRTSIETFYFYLNDRGVLDDRVWWCVYRVGFIKGTVHTMSISLRVL